MRALLPLVFLLSSACGGAQSATQPVAATQNDPASDSTSEERMERLEATLRANTEALQKLAQEQAETLQLFQLVATQLAGLQEKVETLQETPPTAAAPPRPRRGRPNPASVYSIPVADSPSVGSRRPLVTIIKGFEFACPFCERVRPTLEQLQKDYRGDLRIVYKHFIVHPQTATEAAVAACAAGKQGKWKRMESLLWEKAFKVRDFSAQNIETLASQAGLRMTRYRSDRDGRCKKLVKHDQAELSQVGTTGTPAFYINGRFLSGARPIDQFKTLIDEELAKAKKRIRNDPALTRANYYDVEILGKGLTKLEPAP